MVWGIVIWRAGEVSPFSLLTSIRTAAWPMGWRHIVVGVDARASHERDVRGDFQAKIPQSAHDADRQQAVECQDRVEFVDVGASHVVDCLACQVMSPVDVKEGGRSVGESEIVERAQRAGKSERAHAVDPVGPRIVVRACSHDQYGSVSAYWMPL